MAVRVAMVILAVLDSRDNVQFVADPSVIRGVFTGRKRYPFQFFARAQLDLAQSGGLWYMVRR